MRNHINYLFKLIILNVILLLFFHLKAGAQQVISPNGNYFSNNSGSVTYTIGEPVVETYSSANQIITQGFNQYFLLVTAVDESAETDFEITAYPNPTSENLTLRVNRENRSDLQYLLFDLNGKLIKSGDIIEAETIIEFEELIAGDYLLRIVHVNLELKTFKIAKTN